MFLQNVRLPSCARDFLLFFVILSCPHWIRNGIDAHPGGGYPCPIAAQEGQNFTLTLPPDLPSQYGSFRVLNRTSNSVAMIGDCSNPGQPCDNPFPDQYEAVTTNDGGTISSQVTIYNVQRYVHEVNLLFRWDSGPDNKLGCVVQVYNFSSDPYCQSPKIVLKDSQFFLIYSCGIKDVYPNPFCAFKTKNETHPNETAFMDWVDDASIPHGDPVFYDKVCYSEPIPLTNNLPGSYEVTFLVAPGTFSGKRLHSKNITNDVFYQYGPNITCDGPRFNSSLETVQVTCSMLSYYNNVSCEFYQQVDSGDYILVDEAYVTVTNGTCSEDPMGCQLTCIFSKDVQLMDLGTYTYRVNATPYFVNVTEPYSITNDTDSLEIKLPTAQLLNCPVDASGNPTLSKWGTRVRCRCNLSDVGQPRGSPQWYFPNGTVTGKLIKGVAHLVHLFDSSDTNPNFTCKGVSYKGESTGVNFTIEYAFGPNTVIAGSPSPNPYDLCPPSSPGTGITVTCNVPQESVKPNTNMTLTGVSMETYSPTSSSIQNNSYSNTFEFNVTSGGTHTVKCVAINSLYGDFVSSAETTISVREPPSSPPSFNQQNGDILPDQTVVRLREGQDFSLYCAVRGGLPEVTSVNMTCANVDNTTAGTVTSQSLTVERSLHQDRCVCSAEHVTGCYDLTTAISFNVEFPAEIPQFVIQGQSADVTVQSGSEITMDCVVDANPAPRAEIQLQRSNEMLVAESSQGQGQFGTSFRFSKVMSRCQDMDIFTCVARNGIGTSVNKSIQVYVQCQPELEVPSEDSQRFTISDGGNFSITYSIISYPIPTNIALSKQDQSGSYVEVDSGRYQEAITPGASLPYISNVSIEIGLVNYEERGQYVLTVSNGIGNDLRISFVLSVLTGAAQVNKVAATVSGSVIGAVVLLGALGSFIWFKFLRGSRPRVELRDPGLGVFRQAPSLRQDISSVGSLGYYNTPWNLSTRLDRSHFPRQ